MEEGFCAEERGLTRSSSLVAGEIGKMISVPSLERSSSLPLSNPSPYPELQGLRHSAEEGAGSKQENDSMVSRKKAAKEIRRRSGDAKQENPAKKPKIPNHCSPKGDATEILRKMPSVTTTGDGPNGKRIEGFLYKYRSGEVCIVCVCHANFLTPAEFVMHAGGKEVENPMKHITVYSSSF